LLFDAFKAMAADAGFSGVSLHVWADNTSARKLYESRGFKAIQAIDMPRRDSMPHSGARLLMQA
jgi:ribosomal protein S18 acetylase RimI-like enzyme